MIFGNVQQGKRAERRQSVRFGEHANAAGIALIYAQGGLFSGSGVGNDRERAEPNVASRIVEHVRDILASESLRRTIVRY